MHDTPVVILCGGLGTRLREMSERLPKAMIELGGRPILWHIMKIYGHYGYRRFLLCLGYKGWDVKRFFLDHHDRTSDFTLHLADRHRVVYHGREVEEDWEVTFAETGLETATGARLRRIRRYIDTTDFMMTYCDGVAAVDLSALEQRHRASGRIGTVTAVRPGSRFGEINVSGDQVVEFTEKPRKVGNFVSGGFFMFRREFLDRYLDDDPDLRLEEEPLHRLAGDGQLTVYEHNEFWHSLDTYKDYLYLNSLWSAGDAQWKVWC